MGPPKAASAAPPPRNRGAIERGSLPVVGSARRQGCEKRVKVVATVASDAYDTSCAAVHAQALDFATEDSIAAKDLM